MLKIPFLNQSNNNISLSQLQKTYLDNQKRKHQYSSSTLTLTNLPKFNHQDIKIKSPFYRKICQKINCKCQYHKKQKIPIPKFMHGIKRDLINFNRQGLQGQQSKYSNMQNKNSKYRTSSSLNRNITLLKSIRQSSQFNKEKRFKTLAQDDLYEGIDLEQARKQYEIFLASQKKKNKGLIDCHNIQFQEFLKSRYLCILENFKKPSRKDLYKKNRLMFKKNYLSTEFNNDSDADEQGNNSSIRHGKQGDQSLRGTNLSHFRRMSKLNFGSTTNALGKKQEFNQIINKLKDEYFGNQQVSSEKLLALICKNLMTGDQSLKQQTKKFIKRLSQVPLALFKSLFSDMKQELKTGINIDLQNIKKTQGDVQNAVKSIVNEVQSNIEQLVKQKKQKKGDEKITILNKFRKQINSAILLGNNLSSNLSKKTRRSKLFTDPSQFFNWDNTELGQHSLKGQNDSNIDEIDQENDINSSSRNENVQDFHMLKDKSNSIQVRKATKNNKKTNQKKIIRQIQSQIEKANQLRKPIQNKTFALPQQIAYEKRRAQSRRKLRQQESRNHREFIQMMKQKQLQRQSSTLSEYQAQKNTMKSHFQRNKVFLKKMQMTLGNSQLKDVVINLQDDVLTKKRKMRLLQNMIEVQQIKETSFYHDMRKYIDIYEKNCMLATKEKKKEKKSSSGRYTKRLFLSREKYFDYQLPEMQTKKSNEQIQLLEILKLDDQLKFYLVNLIECQGQEDPDNYTIKIPQSISHKQVARKRHRNIWYRLGEEHEYEQEQNQCDNDILGQVGLNNKFPQQKIRNRLQQQYIIQNIKQKKMTQKQKHNFKQEDSILKLQSRFQKKMKEYRRIFKTCGNQP